MISWGPEDAERLVRFKKLGYSVGHIDGTMYHMEHLITYNSSSSNPHFKKNEEEFEKIKHLSKTELIEYVKTFNWLTEENV